MPDGRKNNGGKRKGAGRPSKAEELGIVAMMEEIKPTREVFELLAEQMKNPTYKMKAIELWCAYAIGKPKETVKQTVDNNVVITSDTDFKIP